MIKKERPKSAALERMGSSAAFAQQKVAVAEGNFRNIKARARIWQLESLLCLDNSDKNIASLGVLFTRNTLDNYWQLPQARKELAHAVGLLSPKADFLRSNVTLQENPPLSKELQGENR